MEEPGSLEENCRCASWHGPLGHGPHSASLPCAAMVVRNGAVFIHDEHVAREMAMKIADAIIDKTPVAPTVTLQAAPGEGWRSRAAEKQLKKKPKGDNKDRSADPPDYNVTMDGSLLENRHHQLGVGQAMTPGCPGKFAHLHIEEEVSARMKALEEVVRAQVKAQVLLGLPCHDARCLLPPDKLAVASHAKHTFGNIAPFADTPLRTLKKLARNSHSSSQLSLDGGGSVVDAQNVGAQACCTSTDSEAQSDPVLVFTDSEIEQCQAEQMLKIEATIDATIQANNARMLEEFPLLLCGQGRARTKSLLCPALLSGCATACVKQQHKYHAMSHCVCVLWLAIYV